MKQKLWASKKKKEKCMLHFSNKIIFLKGHSFLFANARVQNCKMNLFSAFIYYSETKYLALFSYF